MPKITNANYEIPEITPLQWVRTLDGGANKPIVIRGVEVQKEQTSEYVLKYRGAERMDESACRRELLASWIAAEIDIWTPEPVIIHVDGHFATMVPSELRETLASRALGINFGTRYIPGNASFQPETVLPSGLHQTAARVFAFDILMQNSDRRKEKPNAFLADDNIYVYDHELSFGFLSMLPMFANPTPWVLNAIDISAAERHLFYPLLHHNRSVNWDAAVSTFSHLSPFFWQCANEHLPATWRNHEEMTRIQSHFDSIQQNLQTFISEIWNKIIG